MKTPTQQEVKDRLHYDPETGVMTWVKRPSLNMRAGMIAGNKNTTLGYHMIVFNKQIHRMHRIIWLYVHGCMPTGQIDHINGDGFDNRLSNLREVTFLQNQINKKIPTTNKSGHKGVSFVKATGKWKAYGTANKTYKSLGYFVNIDEAIKARQLFENECFGEFNRIKAISQDKGESV